MYEWGYEFNATRSFGHTEDLMLVPFLDYLNYDPSTYSNVEFLTYDSREELFAIIDSMFVSKDEYEKMMKNDLSEELDVEK